MPDLAQIEQTCLPTSTANLIIWFGKHGYPKLIMDGETEDERYLHTVHRIMATTDARFDWGTQQSKVASGIEKYIRERGYSCDVEYRGLDYKEKGEAAPEPFTQDWLKDNDDPNKGFILLLAYCACAPGSNTYVNVINAGHAVTLVNAQSDMLLIHDPAHDEDETGRKIITPQALTDGTFREMSGSAPVSGLLLLSGSLLEAPPDSDVMLTGAVCITMHPGVDPSHSTASTATGPSDQIDGKGTGKSSDDLGRDSHAKPSGTTTMPWWMWIFTSLFGK